MEAWRKKPWRYTLFWYLTLQEADFRESWTRRMERQDAAELTAIAFHEPKRLGDERERALAAASNAGHEAAVIAEALERGRAFVTELDSGKIVRGQTVEVH